MSETSGFFEAKLNSVTNEYDRVYYAEQFANYFKLFIGNGVFASPTDQLLVEADSGMNIIVNSGWAFINGYWYNNSDNLTINIPVNTQSVERTDIVVARYDNASRDIHIEYLDGESSIRRDGSYYDLLLATVTVPVGSSVITDAVIKDNRSNENVCGFVKGLVDVVTTDDLFKQYEAQFNEWFTKIKNSLDGDIAGNLQNEIEEITETEFNRYYNLINSEVVVDDSSNTITETSEEAVVTTILQGDNTIVTTVIPNEGNYKYVSTVSSTDTDNGTIIKTIYTKQAK